MSDFLEPDDVDFFVGGVEPDEKTMLETERLIEEYKSRPEFRFEAEEARRILATLGLHPPDYGIPNAKDLLGHWQRCVSNLRKAELEESESANVEQDQKSV